MHNSIDKKWLDRLVKEYKIPEPTHKKSILNEFQLNIIKLKDITKNIKD